MCRTARPHRRSDTEPGRGRTARLHVTAAGADLVAAGFAVLADADRRLLGTVPADQHEPLTRALWGAFVATPDGGAGARPS